MRTLFFSVNLLVVITSSMLIFLLLIYGKNKLARLWLLCNIATFFWGIGTTILSRATNESLAFSGWMIAHAGGYFVPLLYYHAICIFTEKKNKRPLIIAYIFILVAEIVTLLTGSVINIYNLKIMFNSIFYPQLTIMYVVIYFGWAFICTMVCYELFKFMKLAKGTKFIQSKYLLVAAAIGLTGGGSVCWPTFGIQLYPLGNIGVTLYCLIGTYAILRHQVMDIEVVIKKSIVFAGMFIFIFGVVVAVAMTVAQLLGGTNNLLSLAISALIITFMMRPIETLLINTTDKFLFQKKHEYKEILKAFIDEVITVLNLDEIISSTLSLLDQAIHPYTSAIFILNRVEDKYQLYNSRGLGNKEVIFNSDSRLVSFLKNSHQPAIIKQIDGIMGVSPDIQQEMAGLEAVVCLPLLLHNDLIGFISLGKKKSDLEYTKDDLDILLDLARTESVAVGNAQLLQEAAQSERRAAIGTMAAGIHHEIGNPLNIINTKIQVFLTGIERGFYRNKSKEEIILECKKILNDTLSQTNRIADITKRLANFAKPSKEFKPQLIDIAEEIGEALAVVSHDLELEKIKIEKQISLELPRVLADKRAMQQVFFNLIRNAAQAIEQSGAITIRGILTREGKVHIEIEDTGKGIADDKKHRIFEPFFTTKGPKGGTGLGLSIVRQLVWQNKGEISFRSQAGRGTTFILEFPKGVNYEKNLNS